MEGQVCFRCRRFKALEEFNVGKSGRRKKLCAACEEKILKKSGVTRRCHDCGQPTHNYRCAACWRKLRKTNGSGIDPQYLP